MWKQLHLRYCVLGIWLAIYILFSCYLSYYVVPYEGQKLLPPGSLSPKSLALPTTAPKRRSLLIIGMGRSGTSFVTSVFGIEQGTFEVYEPFRYHELTNSEKLQVLSAFLSCEFSTMSTLWEKAYYPPYWNLEETKYQLKPEKNLACLRIHGRRLNRCTLADKLFQAFVNTCKNNFQHTVVKELTNRIPNERLSSVIPEIFEATSSADVRILHVVRDPRASINSRIKLHWLPDYQDPSFEQKVQNYCDRIAENIEFGRKLNESLKHKYKLILYQDIARRPVDTARDMLKFAGFNMSEDTIEWIKNHVNPNEDKLKATSRNAYSLVRDSKMNIDKWRNESSPERTGVIERVCKPLLELIEELKKENDW